MQQLSIATTPKTTGIAWAAIHASINRTLALREIPIWEKEEHKQKKYASVRAEIALK